MIEVSIRPSRLAVGRPTRLSIEFANVSRGPCSNITFRLELPSGIALLDGRGKVDIASLQAGGKHIHEITVEASRSGVFGLTSANFSYRDQYDVPADGAALRLPITATDNGKPPPYVSARPTPRLVVRLEDADDPLAIGSWGKLRILARNPSDAAVADVFMDVSGSLRTSGRRSRLPQLGPRVTARFTFDVIADDAGQVPFDVRTTFTYPAGLGSIRQASQDDGLRVEVARPAQPGSAIRTRGIVLYLTASPKDPDLEWLPLRSDLEMRKVKERLQMSRHRDEYRIEPCLAARWDDVSQALVDHDPQVVHFSGHGDDEGNLVLEDDAGGVALTTSEGLARLFGLHKSTIKCVIVNACSSERLARAVSERTGYVVGMRSPIGDEAAIRFSVGFYTGLFAGQQVPAAFERGVAAIEGSETTRLESLTPILLQNGRRLR